MVTTNITLLRENWGDTIFPCCHGITRSSLKTRARKRCCGITYKLYSRLPEYLCTLSYKNCIKNTWTTAKLLYSKSSQSIFWPASSEISFPSVSRLVCRRNWQDHLSPSRLRSSYNLLMSHTLTLAVFCPEFGLENESSDKKWVRGIGRV